MRKKAEKTTRSKWGGKDRLRKKRSINTEKVRRWECKQNRRRDRRLSEGHPVYLRSQIRQETQREVTAW